MIVKYVFFCGGRFVFFDVDVVKNMFGVEKVVEVLGGVVVVVIFYWCVKKVVDVLLVNYDDCGNGGLNLEFVMVDFRIVFENEDGLNC